MSVTTGTSTSITQGGQPLERIEGVCTSERIAAPVTQPIRNGKPHTKGVKRKHRLRQRSPNGMKGIAFMAVDLTGTA